MLSDNKIKEIIDYCKNHGFDVRVRDIAYSLLTMEMENARIAYQCIFGSTATESEADSYAQSERILFLNKKVLEESAAGENITFEENKAYMLRLKRMTEAEMAAGQIDKKDAIKILAEISVKLNDKFAVAEETRDQIVMVNVKYNSICKCGRELYIPTKEDLMHEYNLVEKE